MIGKDDILFKHISVEGVMKSGKTKLANMRIPMLIILKVRETLQLVPGIILISRLYGRQPTIEPVFYKELYLYNTAP